MYELSKLGKIKLLYILIISFLIVLSLSVFTTSQTITSAQILTPNVSDPSVSPNPVVVRSSVAVSVTVSGLPNVPPTGTVTFQVKIGSGEWANVGSAVGLTAGSASTTYTPLSVDSYQFQAIYSGDSVYNDATSSVTALTVNKAAADVAVPILSPSSPISLGGSVTAFVTVSGISGVTPTGTVTFQYSVNSGSSWSTLGTVKTLSSGSATSDPYTPTVVGSSHRIRAVYSGDINYNSTTGNSASLTVNKATPTVPAPSVNPNPVVVRSSVAVSVTVSGLPNVPPSGTVTFQVKVGSGSWTNFTSAATLTAGSASTTYTPLSIDSYQFQAVYNGDNNYYSATGSVTALTVNKAAADVAVPILSPSSPISLGGSVTAFVTVSGISGVTPTGSVTFQYSVNGGSSWSTLGTIKTLSSGSAPSAASDLYTPLAVGSNYRIRAVYSGDDNYGSATGNSASLTVNKVSPTVSTPSVSPNPVVVRSSVTVSVTVSGSGATPSGTVTFQVKVGSGSWANVGSTVALSAGSASTTYTPLSVDSYQFRAIYNGDSNYNSATSSATALTVNVGSANHFIVSSESSQTAGIPFSVTVTIKDAFNNTITNYAGTVKITSSDNSAVLPPSAGLTNGVGSFTVTLKTAGSQSLTATDMATSSIVGSQSGIQVNPANLDHFGISVPGTVTAGSTFANVAVTAYDIYNNVKTDYRGSVYFTSSDNASVLPFTSLTKYSFTSADSGIYTFSGFTLKTAPSQTLTVTNGSISKQSTSITVNAASLDHFVFDDVQDQKVDNPFNITITAKDTFGNTVTDYAGAPSLTYSAGSITPTTMTDFVAGVGSASVTVNTPGSGVTITAVESNRAGVSNPFTVVIVPTPTPIPPPTQNPTTTPKPTTSTTPSPTPTSTPQLELISKSLLATANDGSATYLTIYGNIKDSDISDVTITNDQTSAETTINLTLLGQNGANSFCNITIPKNAIDYGSAPTVYVNSQIANNQGYTEDASNWYIWFNSQTNSYELSIVFSTSSEFQIWAIVLIIVVSTALVLAILIPRLRNRYQN